MEWTPDKREEGWQDILTFSLAAGMHPSSLDDNSTPLFTNREGMDNDPTF